MRTLIFSIVISCLTASLAAAAVTVVPLDPAKKILRISYEIVDTDAGATGFTFPPQGFDFADGPVKLLTAFNLSDMTSLQAEAVAVGGRDYPTAVKLAYPAPLGIGQTITVRFTVDVPTNYFQIDSQGRWIVRYGTSHDLRFVVPEGHQLVFSEAPVRLEEDGGRIVGVHDASGDDRRSVNFLFKTRPLP